MTPPRWIVEAFEIMMAGPGVGDPEVETLAAALIERLPLEAMRQAAQDALDEVADNRPAEQHAAIATTAIVRLLTDGDPEIATLTELYQGATRALDAAGVPYATGGDDGQIPVRLNLYGRILWLIEQRPTRIDLQRVEAERDEIQRHCDIARGQADARGEELVRMSTDGAIERNALRQQLADMTRDRDYWKSLAELRATALRP